jgi:hypothetical protein
VYAPVPPVALAVAPPSLKPLHVVLLSTTVDATTNVGSVTVTDALSVQPFASVNVTEYVPAITPVILAVVAVLLHIYVYAIVPPVALAVAPPSLKPLQLTLLSNCVEATNTAGSVTVTDALSVQPSLSVIVTEYVPAITPVMLAVVAVLLHKYVYAIVPPVALALAPPSLNPLQFTLLSSTVAATKVAGSVTVTDVLSVQPFASVIVTL